MLLKCLERCHFDAAGWLGPLVRFLVSLILLPCRQGGRLAVIDQFRFEWRWIDVQDRGDAIVVISQRVVAWLARQTETCLAVADLCANRIRSVFRSIEKFGVKL